MADELMAQTHFVYLLRCADGTLYTGSTTDVARRVATHNAGKGARYTRGRRPVALLAAWPYFSRGEALRAERAIKRLKRAQKLQLGSALQAEEAGRPGTRLGTMPHARQDSLEDHSTELA